MAGMLDRVKSGRYPNLRLPPIPSRKSGQPASLPDSQLAAREAHNGDGPRQPLFGARYSRYRCSLPGLAGFTVDRREGTDAGRHRLFAAFKGGGLYQSASAKTNCALTLQPPL